MGIFTQFLGLWWRSHEEIEKWKAPNTVPGIQRVIKEWPLAKQGRDNRQVVWTQDREQYNRDSREHQGATLSGVITVTDLYDPAVRAAKCIKVRKWTQQIWKSSILWVQQTYINSIQWKQETTPISGTHATLRKSSKENSKFPKVEIALILFSNDKAMELEVKNENRNNKKTQQSRNFKKHLKTCRTSRKKW